MRTTVVARKSGARKSSVSQESPARNPERRPSASVSRRKANRKYAWMNDKAAMNPLRLCAGTGIDSRPASELMIGGLERYSVGEQNAKLCHRLAPSPNCERPTVRDVRLCEP